MKRECVAGDKRGTNTGYTNRKCRCDECRTAAKEYKRRHYEANREAVRERQRRHYEANREALLEKHRQYREANRETVAEQKRRWDEANREAVREQQRQYYEANPDKARAKWHTRRARKHDAFVETVVPRQVFERDNWICHICNKKINRKAVAPQWDSASIDHVIALAKGRQNGGVHSYANIVATHLRCNISKGAR